MTSGPDGGLYVAIPDGKAHVLALLGADGATRAGWPIRVSSPWCPRILSGEDGSVRLLCDPPTEGDDGLQEPKVRVFGFDAHGRTLSGWPIDVAGGAWRPTARMIGPDLAILIRPYMGDSVPEDTPEQIQLGLIDSRGGLQVGSVVEHDCCQADYAIGPDGTGYVVQTEWSESATRTTVAAFRLEGPFASWPVTIEGYGSSLAFDDEGRIHLAVGGAGLRESRTVVMDQSGQVLPVGADDLPIELTSSWSGAGDPPLSAPVVGARGTTFLVSEPAGTEIVAVDGDGALLPGWPYRSSAGLEDVGRCGGEVTGCGVFRVEPVIDNDDVLYVSQSTTSSSAGGRLIALTDRGRVVEGWPVKLTRPGSYFVAIVPSHDGVWALALEPEGNGSSATVLSIGPDSTVRWTTTIADP